MDVERGRTVKTWKPRRLGERRQALTSSIMARPLFRASVFQARARITLVWESGLATVN